MKELVEEFLVCVCIPTYLRYEGLRSALHSLTQQTFIEKFAVIVANNNPGDELVAKIIDSFRDRLAIELIDVTERGVSAVRNAAIHTALSKFPAVKWILFQDDDEVADDRWIAELVKAAERHNADMVGGGVNIVAKNTYWLPLLNAGYVKPETGIANMLCGTNNLLVSSKFLKSLTSNPFNSAYGLSGGEDYEFFRSAQSKKAIMVWSNEAKITEYWPIDRGKFKNIFHREFMKGAYMARVDVQYDGQLGATLKTFKSFLRPFKTFIKMAGSRRYLTQAFPLFIIQVGCGFGRVCGHFGRRTKAYGN